MKPIDWLERAKKFLRSAERNLIAGEYEIACFDSHQAAELALKGLHILKYGSRPYTHDLIALAEPFGFDHEFLLALTSFYTPSRYPESAVSFNEKIAIKCVETAREVIVFVEREFEKSCGEVR
ncbi:MAG: HEPN domain-containing protein, partial [Candidatus Korarchaeum sp.]|nr:HEPN domain-containing protein [Candidatus Korarchaeum sp.]MDW8035190.1 HEPN domain-containing protein [Candidatus Korarchaeum sp.]